MTIVGAVSVATGNPADEYLATELASLANLEVRLSDSLAVKHIFPALDLNLIAAQQRDQLLTKTEQDFEYHLRNKYLPENGATGFLEELRSASTYEELIRSVCKMK